MNRSDNNIDEILNSFDGIQRAEARPFMYTRVMARMVKDDKTVWSRAVSFIARPAVALACMVAVIVTNVFFVSKTQKEESATIVSSVSNNYAVEDYMQGDNLVLAVNNIETNE